MVAGEVKSSCQLVATFFFFFFGLTLPNYRNKSGSAQPPLISTTSSAADALQCIQRLASLSETNLFDGSVY